MYVTLPGPVGLIGNRGAIFCFQENVMAENDDMKYKWNFGDGVSCARD